MNLLFVIMKAKNTLLEKMEKLFTQLNTLLTSVKPKKDLTILNGTSNLVYSNSDIGLMENGSIYSNGMILVHCTSDTLHLPLDITSENGGFIDMLLLFQFVLKDYTDVAQMVILVEKTNGDLTVNITQIQMEAVVPNLN